MASIQNFVQHWNLSRPLKYQHKYSVRNRVFEKEQGNLKMKKAVLVIGAHLDECECGECGGISLKFVKLGYKVVFLNTVGNLRSWSIVHNEEDEKILIREAYEAARILGARKIFLDYPNNCFPEGSFEAIIKIAQVAKEVNPEIALIHWPKDNHYDHVRTSKASLEALSQINRFGGGEPIKINLKEILAYEASSWQTEDFKPDFFIDISEEIETVFQAMGTFKHIGTEGYIEDKKAQCRLWGIQSGFKYAEGFKHLGPYFPIQSLLPTLFGRSLKPTGYYGYPWGKQHFE